MSAFTPYSPPPILSSILTGPSPSGDITGATDTANLQAILTAAGAGTPRAVYLWSGVYNLNATLTIPAGVALIGQGLFLTTLKRAAAYGTVIAPSGDKVVLQDFGLDGGLSSFAGSANHGISTQNANHFRAIRLYIFNYLNSAILCQGTPSRTYFDAVIKDCYCDGLSAANNGFLIANMDRSHMRGCAGENIVGSPGYACQIKNDSRWCSIDDCDAYLCSGGLVFGFDATTANGPIACRISGGSAASCDGGILMGAASDCVADGVDIWQTTNVNDAIRLNGKGDGTNGSVNNSLTGITVHGVGASRACVRFDDVSVDNMVTLDLVDASGATTVTCTGSSDRNTVEVKKYNNTPPTHELSNSSTGTQNRIRRVEDRETLRQIALGAISQSFDRQSPTAALVMTSQQPYYIPVYLFAGEVVTNITIHLSTNGGAPTNFYVGVYSVGLTRLAVSADQAGLISTTTGQKILPLSAPYVVLDSGWYYMGLLNNGGTLSPLGLASSTAARLSGSVPYPYAQDTSTTSTTLPSPGTIAAGTKAFWVEVS